MNRLANLLAQYGLLRKDLDYHLVLAAMVIMFWFFGYQKWFSYEARVLIPYIAHGPLIFWLHSAFGIQGASWFLGVSEWLIFALLLLGFWYPAVAAFGALGSVVTFVCTVTIIPYMPNAWAAESGGFPAMGAPTAFLIKDVVLLAVSVYLLKQSLLRIPTPETASFPTRVLFMLTDRLGLLQSSFDYGFVRASLILIFGMFGYGKFFIFAARQMLLYVTHGPLIFWLNPLLGFWGESYFLGTVELTTCTLLLLGFWYKKAGMMAALIATFTFISTFTIIPFMPNGWAASAGGFPAMVGEVPFLMKDVVLLAISIYLLKQDTLRVLAAREAPSYSRVTAA